MNICCKYFSAISRIRSCPLLEGNRGTIEFSNSVDSVRLPCAQREVELLWVAPICLLYRTMRRVATHGFGTVWMMTSRVWHSYVLFFLVLTDSVSTNIHHFHVFILHYTLHTAHLPHFSTTNHVHNLRHRMICDRLCIIFVIPLYGPAHERTWFLLGRRATAANRSLWPVSHSDPAAGTHWFSMR